MEMEDIRLSKKYEEFNSDHLTFLEIVNELPKPVLSRVGLVHPDIKMEITNEILHSEMFRKLWELADYVVTTLPIYLKVKTKTFNFEFKRTKMEKIELNVTEFPEEGNWLVITMEPNEDAKQRCANCGGKDFSYITEKKNEKIKINGVQIAPFDGTFLTERCLDCGLEVTNGKITQLPDEEKWDFARLSEASELGDLITDAAHFNLKEGKYGDEFWYNFR